MICYTSNSDSIGYFGYGFYTCPGTLIRLRTTIFFIYSIVIT